MSLQIKIEIMSNKYRELKGCEFPVIKTMIIAELRKMAKEASQIMGANELPSNTKRRRQIDDVLKKCERIEQELAIQTDQDLGGGGRCRSRGRGGNLNELGESQLVKMAMHSVMFHEIRTSELKIKPEEYNELYERMCNNRDVIKQFEIMVREQGNDLDKVDQYLESIYQNVEATNQELDEAKQLQKQGRRLKFKMAVSGFFGALGYKLLGLPGLVLGLFTGHKASG